MRLKMKIEIRKTNYHIKYIETSSGWFSSNLYGSNLHFDLSEEGKAVLVIDLTKNFLVKNKAQNDYQDAVELRNNIDKFSVIQISKDFFHVNSATLDPIKGKKKFIRFVFPDVEAIEFPITIEKSGFDYLFRVSS